MGEAMSEHTTYRDGKVHVAREKCSTCIFRPKERPVEGARVAEMIRETMSEPGGNIVCHHTLYDMDGKDDREHAICRGWYDRFADRDPILRMAQAEGIIVEQDVV